MSYSRNLRSVSRVQQILDELLAVDGEREWAAKNAHKLAYEVRQAFTAAITAPVEFRKYAILKERFLIRARDGFVLAEPRVSSAYEGARVSTAKLSLADVTTVEEAIGAACQHNVEEIHMPSFPNDDAQLIRLFSWTELNKISIINHYGAGITLSRRAVGELKWTPD